MAKNKFIIIMIILIISFQFLNGCIEEDSGNISIEGKENYDSIQSIIDNANIGDTIQISPGIYDEILIIDKQIKLIATDKNSTIINNSGNQSDISIITINSDNCIVDGFKIINSNISKNINGIKITSSNNVITNNKIQNTNNGIFLENSNNNEISNNTLSKNTNGLYMTSSTYNNILSNKFSDNQNYGIFSSTQSNKNTFKYNYLSNNVNGIRIKGSEKNQIEKNIVQNSVRRGIYLCCGTANNYVFNNSLINNNPNVDDRYNNQWHFNKVGNYWSDYIDKYPNSNDENTDGIWDVPYIIYKDNEDLYPLISPILSIE
jgi:parallel beta-helix repeat protein